MALCALCLIVYLTLPHEVHASDAEPKRVLVVHSFGSSAPPFTTHSTAFETTLTQEMGMRVDLDQVSLDMARYAQPDMEEAFVEFLRQRLTKWQPDLVVPIGAPAGRFVVKFRDRLFPGTPVIYTGMDRRTVPPDAITKNATFVGEDFKLAGLVEDILQLAPDTTNIEVILGATPLERYWTIEFRRAFEPFTNRVSFNFLNDLAFDQMLGRLSKLPPRSFILLGLLLRDASGVTHNEDEALQRLRAVANAPINGLYQNQMGLGIVGGRLHQGELQGVESARIAVRVLRGEPVSSFPPMFVGKQRPRYDWRELQRWNISEDRLPPGSVIEFRQPTVWKRYQGWIIGALAIICLQAAMIVALVVQRRRRRRIQAVLQESQQLMELATNAGELGLWSRDLTNGDAWGNGPMRSLFGFGPTDPLRFDDMLARVHPDDQARMRSEVEAAEASGLPFQGEFRTVLPGGTERWVLAKGRTVVQPGDVVSCRVGVLLDITERKWAEQKLRESEERFRTMADAAPVMIWLSDTDKLCTFFNKGWLDFTGRTLEQELGNGWAAGVHKEDFGRCLEVYTHAFDARQEFTMEYRLRRHDGEYRWVLDHGVPRRGPEKVFLGYIGTAVDITERKRAAEALENERQFLRQVIDISPNFIFAKDRDGRFTLANRAVAEAYGTTVAELIGKTDADFNPNADEIEFFHKMDLQVINNLEERFIPEEHVTDAKGKVRWLQTVKRPIIDESGSANQVLGTSTDITQRKATEEELRRQREELAHLTRVWNMGELAASLAHELNQPLTAILSNAQAAQRFLSGKPSDIEEVREILHDIVEDNKRAGEVIRRMRALVKREDFEFSSLDLSDIIREIMSLVHSDAILRNVRVRLGVDPALPHPRGDKVQLQQVLLNLLLNAFDAMRDSPADEREVLLRAELDGPDMVRISITDRGTGLTSDQLDKIFQPFFTTKREGLGMGLSISRSIVDVHGGRLWAENNIDQGATFSFTLPVSQATERKGYSTGPIESPASSKFFSR
jgi:PAS domain S-box-containing protein